MQSTSQGCVMTDDPRAQEAAAVWAALQEALDEFGEHFGRASALLDVADSARTQAIDRIIGALCELVLLESLEDPSAAQGRINRVVGAKGTEWRRRFNPGKQKTTEKRDTLKKLAEPLYAEGLAKSEIAKKIWDQISSKERLFFSSQQAISKLLGKLEEEKNALLAEQENQKAAIDKLGAEFRKRGIATFLDTPDRN